MSVEGGGNIVVPRSHFLANGAKIAGVGTFNHFLT